MATTVNWIDLLASFNTKERFYLIRQALAGQSVSEQRFILSDDFRERLAHSVGFEIPADAFAAMDYHLDWLHASLFLKGKNLEQEIFHNIDDQGTRIIVGNPQDIDLLIAFTRDDIDHLVLVEAKGYMAWERKQLSAKAKRLDSIFSNYETRYPNLRIRIVALSPRVPSPSRTEMEHWPDWMQQNLRWLELIVLDSLKLTRCDEQGKQSSKGEFFMLECIESNEEELHIPC